VPGPWNFYYHTRQSRLFENIGVGDYLWIVIRDAHDSRRDWLLVEKISVAEKRHKPKYERPYQIVGDTQKSEFCDIVNQADLTAILHELSFVSGNKVTADRGKLAQSLQTIRVLTSGGSKILQRYSKTLSRTPKLIGTSATT
jgi:hypothetical protein